MTCLCAGCHTPLIVHARQRNPRRWCSAACRNRAMRLMGRYVSAGGPTTDQNLRAAHRRCNQDKGDRLLGVEYGSPIAA